MNTKPDFRSDRPLRAGANRLLLGNYVRQAEIGAFGEERGTEQTLRFNLTVETRPPEGPVGADDDVDGILSYDTLVQTIDAVLHEERLDLLEPLAERVSDRLLALPMVTHVTLRIEKLDRGPFALGIEIERARPAGLDLPDGLGAAHRAPVVAVVSAAAARDGRFGQWLSGLMELGKPVILTACDAPGPDAALDDGANRQIALLAMEQAAWAIAGRDDRCRVVESRTELKHAIDTGTPAVWAPARLVRRSNDPRVRHELIGDALVHWFALGLGAECVVALDAQPLAPAADTSAA